MDRDWPHKIMNGEEVLHALTLACSQDPSLLKVGERQLEAWKREQGFLSVLAVSSNYTCTHKHTHTEEILVVAHFILFPH